MNSFVGEICSRTKDLINIIDGTMVEVVLYVRGETMMYDDEDEFRKQLRIQADVLQNAVSVLDTIIAEHKDFLESANPPENVPGQVMAIAEVIVARIQSFDQSDEIEVDDLFRSLPMASRHELMARLRAYRDFMLRAAGLDRAKSGDPGFRTDPIMPYWW